MSGRPTRPPETNISQKKSEMSYRIGERVSWKFGFNFSGFYCLEKNVFSDTEAHTHKPTNITSTQVEWRQPDTGAWFRGEERKAFVSDKGPAHTQKGGKKKETKCQGKPIFTETKKNGFEHIELPEKLLEYFLQNNQSNINQSDKH